MFQSKTKTIMYKTQAFPCKPSLSRAHHDKPRTSAIHKTTQLSVILTWSWGGCTLKKDASFSIRPCLVFSF